MPSLAGFAPRDTLPGVAASLGIATPASRAMKGPRPAPIDVEVAHAAGQYRMSGFLRPRLAGQRCTPRLGEGSGGLEGCAAARQK
eukprot:15442523-Alexandrium_andersonii.AAC.1